MSTRSRETLDAELSPEDARRYKRRYNVAPSDLHWIVEYGADRRVLARTWGYVPTSPRRARAQAAHQRARRAGRVGARVPRGVRVAALRRRHRRFFEWNTRARRSGTTAPTAG
jgi:putative SOS response-associated peptidase YedK